MKTQFIVVCFCLLKTLALGANEPVPVSVETAPHWISVTSGSAATFTREFDTDRPVQRATLKLANDFCFATVSLNSRAVIDVAPFCQLQTIDVTNWMQRGKNQLTVECREMTSLSAIAVSLEIEWVDGTRSTIVSDSQWTAASTASATPVPSTKVDDRGAVSPELWGIGRRDISLSAYENYEQWQQSKGEVADKNRPKFWIAPGFEITEVRVAQPDEGSWIAMAFDDRGRLTISREDVGLLRMTLAEDRKSVAKVEHIDVKLEECRGLAYDGETLYANANNSKALFRLKIDDEGKAQDVTKLREFPGGVGHGRNDIALWKAPQTEKLSIFSIHGDSVDLPVGEDVEDHTSPLRETKLLPPKKEGSLIRMDIEDGKVTKTHLLHAGLRNPYGIAINKFGDPFTFDADNEHDMGTPWYRPTRILQLVTGGDSGYREVTGMLPPRFHDQPDHTPQLFDIGRSSPTSVMFGYDLKFPEPYRRALFALDWTYGRVIAMHLFPRGSTYRVSAETFLQGKPLNVTDVTEGPDGAMYLTTGGRKTQSALYRVAFTGEAVGMRPSQHEVKIEEAKQTRTSSETTTSRPWVGSSDPVDRHNYLYELEAQGAPKLIGKETSQAEVMAHDLMYARSRTPGLLVRSLDHPVGDSLTDQFIWVRIAQLCLETSRSHVLARRELVVRHVIAAWKALDTRPYSVVPEGTSFELRRRLAYLLGELGAEELPKLAAEKLLASGVQEDQIAGLLALRNQKTGWTLELRKQQFATINSIPQMIGGAGLPPLEKWLREESIKTLTEDEKTALGDLLQPNPPEPEPLPPARPLVQKWMLSELAVLNSNEILRGDAERGRLLFREALCSRCHRVGLRGAAVGPDLTHVSRRFSRRDILESVLTPSLSVAENYRLETITTHAGQVHTGRIIPEGDYRSEKIRLSLDPLDTTKVAEIDKKEIAEHGQAATSPMPSGLFDTLTIEQIADLLAYLESGGSGK